MACNTALRARALDILQNPTLNKSTAFTREVRERFIYLQALASRNERLFYRLVLDHIDEVLPLIYTPTGVDK